MKVNPSYLKPISIDAFKHSSGLNGKIVVVEYVTPKGLGQ